VRPAIIYFFLLLLLPAEVIKGQVTPVALPEVLENLFSRLDNNYDDTDRIHINDSIRLVISSYVRSDSVFRHRFPNLHHLGQIMSPDSILKIVTWNLVLGSRPGLYFCYIIRRGEEGKENKVYSLTTSYRQDSIRTDTSYSEVGWYGALYYDLKPYTINENKCWVLLGIDYGNPYISRKIIDVLSFTPDDSIIFGRKWFVSGDKVRFREVFEYASNGMMTLRFNSEKSIVFDHLVPFNPAHKNDHQFYGPDYSFDAYIYEKGIWKLSINVDARNKE
jgi:hypothetical protein